MLTWLHLGTIARSIFWGCLEISAQVVSASLPCMMPLFVSLRNQERRLFSKYRHNQYRDHKSSGVDGGADPKLSRSRRIRDVFSLGGADPLPEGFELSVPGGTVNDDHFDMRLIDAVPKSSDRIEVTDQIDQVSESITDRDVSGQPTAKAVASRR